MRSKEEIREISEEIRKHVARKVLCEEALRTVKKYAPNVMTYEPITNLTFVTNKQIADAVMASNKTKEAYEAYKKRVEERLTLEDFYEDLGV